MHKVAIVIPVYKEELNEFEKISLTQVQKVLGGKYPIIFVAPEGKNFEYFSAGNGVVYFPQQYFQNTRTYSLLMISAGFYQVFLEYDYILIYQLDAFVFSDKLEYFCSLGYDYIGAPWPWPWIRKTNINGQEIKARVGNGGFSLRKVKTSYDFLINNKDFVDKYSETTEDDFWAYAGMLEGKTFQTAPLKVANSFSVEYFPERCIKKNGDRLPFGCHGWYRFNPESYIKILMQCGYDFRTFKDKMLNLDFIGELKNYLMKLSYYRLNRRINRGQSLLHYLPNNRFASIRVVRSPYTMLILVRLLLENNSLSDDIYFYDENEQDILISDLKLEKLPHLILTNGGAA